LRISSTGFPILSPASVRVLGVEGGGGRIIMRTRRENGGPLRGQEKKELRRPGAGLE